MKNFENFFDTRVSFGLYQRTIGLTGQLGALAGGSLLYLMNSIPFNIQKDYFLTNKELTLILTSFQFGQFFSGLVMGQLMDTFGRALTFRICLSLALLVYSLLLFPFNLPFNVALAFVLGIYGSFTISGYNTLLSETFVSSTRGFWLVLTATSISFGRLWGALAAAIFMSPYQSEFWKKTICTSAYILLTTYLVYLFFLKESLKFLFSKKEYTQFRATANQIYAINRASEEAVAVNKVSVQEMDQLRTQREYEESLQTTPTSISLFHPKFMLLSVITFLNFSIFFMLMNGHVLTLPKFVGMDAKSLWINVFIISGEILGSFICLWLIEKPWLGGKRLILISASLTCLGFLSVQFVDISFLPIVMFVVRVCLKCNLVGWTVYTAEAFPTLLKGKAFGIATSCAGIAATLFPSVFLFLYNLKSVYVLWMMSGLSGVALCMTLFLPSVQEAKKRAQSAI